MKRSLDAQIALFEVLAAEARTILRKGGKRESELEYELVTLQCLRRTLNLLYDFQNEFRDVVQHQKALDREAPRE